MEHDPAGVGQPRERPGVEHPVVRPRALVDPQRHAGHVVHQPPERRPPGVGVGVRRRDRAGRDHDRLGPAARDPPHELRHRRRAAVGDGPGDHRHPAGDVPHRQAGQRLDLVAGQVLDFARQAGGEQTRRPGGEVEVGQRGQPVGVEHAGAVERREHHRPGAGGEGVAGAGGAGGRGHDGRVGESPHAGGSRRGGVEEDPGGAADQRRRRTRPSPPRPSSARLAGSGTESTVTVNWCSLAPEPVAPVSPASLPPNSGAVSMSSMFT